MNIYFVSLGCPRNLVDTETMLGLLSKEGHIITTDPAEADCAVVNTCSFIRPAVEESIDAILELAQWKQEGEGRRLVVVGCLPERYRKDLAQSLPEVDVFLGTGAFAQIGEAVQGALDTQGLMLPPPKPLASCLRIPERVRTGFTHTAYLKIAEGCSGRCTYCIIPALRGRQHSRPMDEILTEAQSLAEAGVQECILVAQNTTTYGQDLKKGYGLEDLLEEMASISGLSWIRVLYGHPDFFSTPLIETIGAHENLCTYFDIPIQHISPSVLKRMGRGAESERIGELFFKIRRMVPGAAIRTTLIVGFPGEKDEDFEMLLDFMEMIRFDHLGVFTYSDDEDLPSHRLNHHVPEEIMRHRYDQAMSLQARISGENNRKYIEQTLQVLIDETSGKKTRPAMGRTAFQAPEIDGIVQVEGPVRQGTFVDVRITEADEYDLTGIAI